MNKTRWNNNEAKRRKDIKINCLRMIKFNGIVYLIFILVWRCRTTLEDHYERKLFNYQCLIDLNDMSCRPSRSPGTGTYYQKRKVLCIVYVWTWNNFSYLSMSWGNRFFYLDFEILDRMFHLNIIEFIIIFGLHYYSMKSNIIAHPNDAS